jgi:hypothetical protein
MKKFSYIIPVILIIISSCTERIDIELDDTYTRLVVSGVITTDTMEHYIDLTRSTDYYYNEAPPPVTGAGMTITDDKGNIYTLTEKTPGRYATDPSFAAVPGWTYTLDIQLNEEINGHNNYSASSTVYPIYPIDSIGLIYRPDWGFDGLYEVTCYYQEPPTKDFYIFNLLINNAMVTDTITERFVSSDEFYNGSYTNGIGVGYLDQSNGGEVLNSGDTVTFQACSITEDYYNYLVSLQSETGFNTPLFSGPPANVKGNISNGAIGFFAAYSVSYSSKVFQP